MLAGCGSREQSAAPTEAAAPELSVPLVEVRPSRITAHLELVGTLIPLRATTIVSDVDGIIHSFPQSDRKVTYEENGKRVSRALGLDIGHRVKQGQPLVQIDPVDFELDLKLAEANLELAKRQLVDLRSWKRKEEIAQLKARVAQAIAVQTQADANLKRAKQLFEKKATSRSNLDEAVMAAQSAEAARAEAEAALALAEAGPTPEQLAVAEAQVAAAEAEVRRKAEKLRKTTIRCPYDAVVSDRYVDVGDRVTAMPRVEILQIIDPSALFAQIAVPEKYQDLVRLDMVASVRAEGVTQAVPAVVDLINAKIDPATRTFRIRVTIDNREDLFKAGGFATVSLPIASHPDALTVPIESVVFSEGRPAVFVYREGHVEKRPVRLGLGNQTHYEIISGLQSGERIAAGRTSMLADGLRVRPAEKVPLSPNAATAHRPAATSAARGG